tara:strand:- start:804 stop:1622 length:819 start_codon:yes stop_codon:yes gene_type:complete
MYILELLVWDFSFRSKYMRIITITFISILLSSCGKQTEEYLYDNKHKDWRLVQQLGAETCINDSAIFQEMQKKNDFSDSFKNDTYFQVEIEKSNGAKYSDFIMIDEVSKDSMAIHYYSEEENPRTIMYTSQNNNDLISAIANGACTPDQDLRYGYGSNSLDNKSVFSFTDTRIDGNEDEYEKVAESYTARVSMPLIFMEWNRKESTQFKVSGSSAYAPKNNTYSVKAISKAQCDSNEVCSRSAWNFNRVNVEVDKNAFSSNALNSRIVEIEL